MKHLLLISALALFGTFAAAENSKVLFLCTGNFYRSRLAEAVFNFEAERAHIPWRAESRGLRTNLLSAEERKQRMSPLTSAKLLELGIAQAYTSADPAQVTPKDMASADCIVAMSESEHRKFLEKDYGPLDRYPLAFWHVEDIEFSRAEDALPSIIRQVSGLVADIKAKRLPEACRVKRPPVR